MLFIPATDPSNYRLRILLDLWQIIVLPSFTFCAILRFERLQLGILAVPTCCAFMLFWALVKRQWILLLQRQQARRLGAALIPCVVGKLPGNIDILFRMMCDFKSSYVLDVYRRLFEEYNCTTLNLRILWTDAVSTTPTTSNCSS